MTRHIYKMLVKGRMILCRLNLTPIGKLLHTFETHTASSMK